MSNELLEQFIGEARELLEGAASSFLALEKDPDDADTMNKLFRDVHTLKGTSGIFDVGPLTGVVHVAEDVLDLVREGKFSLTADDIDLFLDSLDQVSAWLDDLESKGELPDDAASVGVRLSEALRALIPDSDGQPQLVGSTTAKPPLNEITLPVEAEAELPEWLHEMLLRIPDDQLRACYIAGCERELSAIRYQPDPQCFFSGDDPLNNASHVPGLCWHELAPLEAWADADEFDPYHCNLLFYLVSRAEKDDIAHALRYFESDTESVQLSADLLVQPRGSSAESDDLLQFAADADEYIHAEAWGDLTSAVNAILNDSDAGSLQISALKWMALLLGREKPDYLMIKHLLETVRSGEWELFERSKVAVEQATPLPAGDATLVQLESGFVRPADEDLASAVDILRVQMEALSLPYEAEMWAGRHASVLQLLKNLCGSQPSMELASQQAIEEHSFHPLLNWVEAVLTQWSGSISAAEAVALDVVSDIARQDLKQEGGVVEEGAETRKPSFLRVEQERIDQLMDLVGELVVAKNGLPFLSDRAEREFGVKQLAREIKGQYEVVNRLSEEFQNIVMRIRMVSLSSVFQRFPRLVRDLSRRLGKKIELVVEGEETEADKNVVEALSDPLIHLVRNSLDHGIEMPDDRKAADKPEEGSITLRAVQQEDQVLIEVIDDGKGLDPTALKQKAHEKGLIDDETLESISDQDALQLILMAGFSTAEQVSDLSGRGVGMDVVNSMVKQVGGSISLQSKLGEGTTVRLSLPLSMAVTRVMMVSVEKQRFGIPIEQIVETVKVPVADIHQIKDKEAIVLRDRLIPLTCLRDSLEMLDETERSDDDEVAILVVSTRRGMLGLIVDQFHAGLDIIQKPLDGVMAGFPYFSGTALLGDGTVLLILNLEEL